MKKLLSILGILSVVSSGAASVTSLTNSEKPANFLTEPMMAKLNPLAQEIIDVPKTATVEVNQKNSLIIKNYDVLDNVVANSLDKSIASASISYGNVDITGIKLGKTIVTVTADNASTVFIDVEVIPLKTIDVEKTAEVYLGKTTMVFVRNSSELYNLNVNPDNDNVKASFDEFTGYITLEGLKVGSARVAVTAYNAETAYIDVSVIALKEINLEKTEVEIYPNESTTVQIRNISELINPNVDPNNDNVSISLDNGTITIQGQKSGSSIVTVTADNAVAAATITVTVKELKIIDVPTMATVYVDKSINLKIGNYAELINLKATSPSEKITVWDFNGEINIEGITAGNAEITVTADNAITATINVEIKDKKNIDLATENVTAYVTREQKVEINNYNELENVRAVSRNNLVATASTDQQGLVHIWGIKAGTTTVVVSADNANEISIQVKVENLKIIDVDKTGQVYLGKNANVQIRNISELVNPTLTRDNDNVSATIDNGYLVIKGEKLGLTRITLFADNAIDTTITIRIIQSKSINLSHSDVELYVEQKTTVVIANYSDLINITVKEEDKSVAVAGYNRGKILIQGIGQGTTKINVSADNGINTFITVTIKNKKTINLEKETVAVYNSENEQVKIINYSDLENVAVNIDDNSVAQAYVDYAQGVINIIGITAGQSTVINVTADNATLKQIQVEVKPLNEISVDKNQVTVYGLATENITITNFNNLEEVEATSADPEIANVELDPLTGIIAITKTDKAIIGDTTQIEITALHAQKTLISVTIANQLSLTDSLTALAIENVPEALTIDEVIRLNPTLSRDDIKIQENSFQAPDGLKFGKVTIQPNSNKYTGELELLIVPKFKTDDQITEILTRLKNETDFEARKAIWKEYFKYAGEIFFNTLMTANSWNFKNSDFNENKQLKPEIFDYMCKQFDGVMQVLMQRHYREIRIIRDYRNQLYKVNNYQTIIGNRNVTVNFSGYYAFAWTDETTQFANFNGAINGIVID